MEIRRLWPDDVYKLGLPDAAVPASAQVIEVVRTAPGRSVHVAGTFGYDVDKNLVEPSDMAGQVWATMENIRRSLAVVGGTPADVVRVKSYVTDMVLFKAEGVPEFLKFWAGLPPTSTAVQAVSLSNPLAMIEMEAYAELD